MVRAQHHQHSVHIDHQPDGLGADRVTRVSVVMPVHDAAQTVARALESVLAQSRAADEIVVVDDGSADESGDIVRRVGGLRVNLLRQHNRGAAGARNAGIARTTGDVVALIDADDYWHPAKLSSQIEVFDRHPEIVATASNWRWHEAGHFQTGLTLPLRDTGRVLRASRGDVLRVAFSMTASTVAARRDVLVRHPFDESLETAEDRDVWVRVVLEGPVWFEEEVLTTISRRNESLSNRDIDRDCERMLAVLSRYTDMVSESEVRRWEAKTYARWAGQLLAADRPSKAFVYGWERWRREWWSPQALWVLAKCGWQARNAAPGRSTE